MWSQNEHPYLRRYEISVLLSVQNKFIRARNKPIREPNKRNFCYK